METAAVEIPAVEIPAVAIVAAALAAAAIAGAAIAAVAIAAAAIDAVDTDGALVECDCRLTTAVAKSSNRIHAASRGAAFGNRQYGKRSGDDICPLNVLAPNNFCTVAGLCTPCGDR